MIWTKIVAGLLKFINWVFERIDKAELIKQGREQHELEQRRTDDALRQQMADVDRTGPDSSSVYDRYRDYNEERLPKS